jgi:hypothetical protein
MTSTWTLDGLPTTGLDSFYETNMFTTGSTLPLDVLSQLNAPPTQCPDYNELRRQVYEFALEQQESSTSPSLLLSGNLSEEELSELEQIKKYSKLGLDKLKISLRKYQDLIKKKKNTQSALDRIYKHRTEAIYALRRLDDTGNPDNPEIKQIQDEIEALILSKASKHEEQLKQLEQEINRERAVIAYFEDSFRLHKDFKSYSPCMSCMHSEVNAFLIPCGHTFCHDCIKGYEANNKSRTCPCCRSQYNNIGRLFI